MAGMHHFTHSASAYMTQQHLTRFSIIVHGSASSYQIVTWLSMTLHDSVSSSPTQQHLTPLSIISCDSASSHPTRHHFIWPYDPASFDMTQHHRTWLSSILQVSTVVAAFVKQHRYFKWQTAEILCDLRQKSLSTNTRLKTNKQNNRLLIVSMARPCHKIWSKDVARAEVFTIIMTIFLLKKKKKKNQ